MVMFQKIFSKLQEKIFKTRSAIKTVHENISSFNIGKLTAVIKGMELFSDWLSKLPMALENPSLLDFDSSPIKSWIENELKKLNVRGAIEITNELEECIEGVFRKASEIIKAIKSGNITDAEFIEFERKAAKALENFEKLAERIKEEDG
jgi:methyl-accepting chemotaxis protein